MGDERIKYWKEWSERHVKSSRIRSEIVLNHFDAAEKKAIVFGIAQMLKDTTLQEFMYVRSTNERRAGL